MEGANPMIHYESSNQSKKGYQKLCYTILTEGVLDSKGRDLPAAKLFVDNYVSELYCQVVDIDPEFYREKVRKFMNEVKSSFNELIRLTGKIILENKYRWVKPSVAENFKNGAFESYFYSGFGFEAIASGFKLELPRKAIQDWIQSKNDSGVREYLEQKEDWYERIQML